MRLGTQNERMPPISHLISQIQMRRSLTGALAADPVVAERPRRPRRLSGALSARVAHRTGAGLGASPGRAQPSSPKTAEGAQTACPQIS